MNTLVGPMNKSGVSTHVRVMCNSARACSMSSPITELARTFAACVFGAGLTAVCTAMCQQQSKWQLYWDIKLTARAQEVLSHPMLPTAFARPTLSLPHKPLACMALDNSWSVKTPLSTRPMQQLLTVATPIGPCLWWAVAESRDLSVCSRAQCRSTLHTTCDMVQPCVRAHSEGCVCCKNCQSSRRRNSQMGPTP